MNPAKLQRLLQEAVDHHRAGRLIEAEALYRQARGAAPRRFDALHLSGLVAYQQNRMLDAADLLGRALRIDPKSELCEMRLGLALLALGRTVEAENRLRAAVARKPGLVEGWENLAHCLKLQDRLSEALECHRRVVALAPGASHGWSSYGLTLSSLGRVVEALACHDRALVADPASREALFGRAQALQQSHRLAEAVAVYDRLLVFNPAHHEARSYRLFALQHLGNLTREELFEEHLAYGRAVGGAGRPAVFRNPDPDRTLRMAILSPDLRSHSCAFFIEPLLRHLDRSRFELVLYFDHFREDTVSARLRSLASLWRNFVGRSAAEVENVIRADAPDILIDLAGHTGMTHRLPIFARRLAPVQATYLGYPDTTGLPAMDYRFTDAVADPAPEANRFATERLVRFSSTAWAYQPPADAPEPSALPCADGRPLTFGSFNHLGKLTDPLFRLWSRVLGAVPGSRLLLKGPGLSEPAVVTRYRERLRSAGVDADRVDLFERQPDTAGHLALYQRVDIALDTFPYHGTTTTCEALWMGVPVVTLEGDRHVSRVGASLLRAAGHADWVAQTEDDYVRISAELASSLPRLAEIRRGLRGDLGRGALLDHAGQSRRFGEALRECWRNGCAAAARAA